MKVITESCDFKGKMTNKKFFISRFFTYLQVGDLKGAVFHQADPTVVSQNPLPVFLPLDAGDGVAHDVAVQLSGGTRS